MNAKKLSCLALLLAAAAATPAWADGCDGDLVEYKKIVAKDDTVVGQLQFYYNARTGKNCAITKHSDATWGTTLYTGVSIDKCVNKSCSSSESSYLYQDFDDYKYEAGPVRRPGDGCTRAFGEVDRKNGEKVFVFSRPHCGK